MGNSTSLTIATGGTFRVWGSLFFPGLPKPCRISVAIPNLRFMLYKSTTRHIRIFAAEVDGEELNPSPDKLTLDVDPDNELLWNDAALQAVFRKFEELVAAYDGADLTDYNLRRIGSDLEHFVRSLLQGGQVSYNLQGRVRNYSLGLPRVEADISV
jgi:NAD(P)H-quinone oxidoreductase subunit M